eukprot:2612157-Prorocentrum_lima.AAC.1
MGTSAVELLAAVRVNLVVGGGGSTTILSRGGATALRTSSPRPSLVGCSSPGGLIPAAPVSASLNALG